MYKRVEILAERGLKKYFKNFSICKKIGDFDIKKNAYQFINFDIKMRNRIFFSISTTSQSHPHPNKKQSLSAEFFKADPLIPLYPHLNTNIYKRSKQLIINYV